MVHPNPCKFAPSPPFRFAKPRRIRHTKIRNERQSSVAYHCVPRTNSVAKNVCPPQHEAHHPPCFERQALMPRSKGCSNPRIAPFLKALLSRKFPGWNWCVGGPIHVAPDPSLVLAPSLLPFLLLLALLRISSFSLHQLLASCMTYFAPKTNSSSFVLRWLILP